MEVCNTRSLHLLSPHRAFRPSQFGVERVLSLCSFHQTPLQTAFKIALRVRVRSSVLKSPVMSTRKGDSTVASQDMCKVLWSIEADMADGQLMYITGDLVALGCWDPDMAILMSPSTEHSYLWKTEINVPCGVNFKYNYFIKEEKWPSCDLLWRSGPEFSLSVPHQCNCEQPEKIMVRDSWMNTRIKRLLVPPWGSWMEEMYPFIQQTKLSGYQYLSTGQHEIPRILDSDLRIGDESCSLEKEMAKNAVDSGSDLGQTFTERGQPVEEPWLLHSTVISFRSMLDTGKSQKRSVQSDSIQVEASDKPCQAIETVVSKEESQLTCTEDQLACTEDPVSTVILINSSVCTMQRIAVLEDDKLVEILLEPVKNNVQCDSVYLGVVTKLVPHMGGAFVDIGISRPSLMDVKKNREPFVYPPFRCKTKVREVQDSVVRELKESPDAFKLLSHGGDLVVDGFLDPDFQENSVPFMPEDFEELEAEDDIDVSDTLEGNLNGSVVDYDEGEADFEDYLEENGHHMEGETVKKFLPPEMENLNDSEVLHHTLQDLNVSDGAQSDANKWAHVRKGTKVIVQVVKEGLGTKGPSLTAYPNLRSRFWVLSTRCNRIGVSKKITGVERTRLRVIAKTLQPPGFGLTVRTVAAGHSLDELQKDLEGLLSTWKDIVEHAKSAALATDEGVEGAVPVILHRAMGQTLSVVQDYFNEKVKRMIVDSPRTYHEVRNYLQEIAPDLCDRVELYDKRIPIFDEYGIEEEINNILSKRVPLSNGGSLVIEQTEALVSIDVNGGHGMLGQGTSQEKAVLDVNLAAAKQIARELRLRDVGGIIVVDFIDMVDDSNKRLVYEEIKKAVERDRSMVRVSELSKHGLMEITRKRVRPSVTYMISEPCICCHATGRVEALETSFSKIEHEICRLLAMLNQKADPENAKSWPRFVLRVDRYMCNYLTSGKRTKLAVLSSSLKVWILLKVARGFSRGAFEIKPFTDDKANSDSNQVAISRLRPAKSGSCIPNSKLTVFPVKKWKTRGK
eukprot:TRINITY_DN16702_c0_g1_i1.p1 TRINITY_DN16702_c0_g1~~TRINITY_DN16702_c0_g1_i1.p1  ORF type:complete len:1018 (+),score=222.02 TRINITY_DN16702_c0_g1_i1:163-3216(+)